MTSEESFIWSEYTQLNENEQKECQILQLRLLAAKVKTTNKKGVAKSFCHSKIKFFSLEMKGEEKLYLNLVPSNFEAKLMTFSGPKVFEAGSYVASAARKLRKSSHIFEKPLRQFNPPTHPPNQPE